MIHRTVKIAVSTLVSVAGLAAVLGAHFDDRDKRGDTSHVLLLSVDGLHAGDLERFVATHPDSALAWVSARGWTYTHATSTVPSDSFPGLLAMVTGGTSRSTGVYYDDGYDRRLAAASGACVAGARVQWKQNLDLLPFSYTTTIDPLKLPRDPADGCTARVYPHQFPRVNNVFELVKAGGGRTAWADKHPAYEFLNGPSGTGIDDLYTPEITLPAGVTTTNSFQLTMDYDDIKVRAILNEIRGFDHTGVDYVGVPTVFGMNFQAVSVGQKLKVEQLPTAPLLTGGYLDAAGTPSDGLQATLDHTDRSIRQMISALSERRLLDSTLIIVSAKHGNSPVDPASLIRVNPAAISDIVNAVAPIALLSADTGPLIWLKDPGSESVGAAVAALSKSMSEDGNPARIAGILAGAELAALFPHAQGDSRVPDIVLLPIPGTVYTTSGSKIADHGGASEDDVHVALLVRGPSTRSKLIADPVETRQIACTILKALDMNCDDLMSEQIEPSKFLPHSDHKHRGSDDGGDDCMDDSHAGWDDSWDNWDRFGSRRR